MNYANIVTISPEIQSGAPVFSGTRVPIKIIFDYLREGETIKEFLLDFPSVREKQVADLLKLMEQAVTFNFAPAHA